MGKSSSKGGGRMGGAPSKTRMTRGSGLSTTWGPKQSRTTSTGAKIGKQPSK